MNAHAAFRNPGESLIRSWVTPLMFSDCGDWVAEVKRRVCRSLSVLRATVTAVSILRMNDAEKHPRAAAAGLVLPHFWRQFATGLGGSFIGRNSRRRRGCLLKGPFAH